MTQTTSTSAAPPAVQDFPDGVNQALHRQCLAWADDALILAQRLSEWIAHSPQLEEDMALANMSLDLIGQARTLYTYAGEVETRYGATGRDEDALAMLRDEREFRCVHLVQLPRGDFAFTISRQLVFATYQYALYAALSASADACVAALAARAVKEVRYHQDHAIQWTLRLGDGTAESHQRIQAGLDAVWRYVAELFDDTADTTLLSEHGVMVQPSTLRAECEQMWAKVLDQATLAMPQADTRSRGGREGIHTEHLGYVLATMQHIHRSHPGAQW